MTSKYTRFYISKSVTDNTRRTYASVRKNFDRWLQEHQLERTDENLARYLAEMHHTSKNQAKVRCELTVAAERWYTRRSNCRSIVGPTTQLVLGGIRRYSRVSRGQVKGLLWAEADQVCDTQLRKNTLIGLRNAALIGLGSDCLMRPSELQNAHVEDLTLSFKDNRSTFWISRSKTDQLGAGRFLHLGTPTAMVLHIWLVASGVRSGKLFRSVSKQHKVVGTGLSVNAVRTIIQQSIREGGFDGYYSGQSLRVGSAQSLALSGVASPLIMNAGRWESEKMVARYIAHIVPCHAAVAQKRYGTK